MTAVVAGRTLVLNSGWMPVNVVPVTSAIEKVFAERAVFLDVETFQTYHFESWVTNWDEAIRATRIPAERVINCVDFGLFKPEVIVCTEYKGLGYRVGCRKPKFSRTNLFRRDRGQCQFCGRKFKTEELTMDHVVPREQGGKATWDNIVLACVPCNSKKKNRTPEQAGMHLIRQPKCPKPEDLRPNPMERIMRKVGNHMPKSWEQFLGKFCTEDKLMSKMYWSVELQG